jgi:AraC-like DNA-binding protein
MITPLITQPSYRERGSGKKIEAISHTKVLASSDDLRWKGLQLQIARSQGWNVEDLMIDGHMVCMNLAEEDLLFTIRNDKGWRACRLPPKAFWVNPEGTPFSIHHNQDAYYASIFVDGMFMDELMGKHYELKSVDALTDTILSGLGLALVGIVNNTKRLPLELTQQIIHSFVHTLGCCHGHPATAPIKGGIAPTQLNSLLAWLESNLHTNMTVSEMADQAGLSLAHFSREFKRSTGHTPWEYVAQLRLERARKLLDMGETVSGAAMSSGFSDQSHLTRKFKLKYGLTPSAYLKRRRGWFST